ncbi:MAG: alpha-glucosidase [Eubacterium sp.]|nr:alpha-glucosidase [Eubacterium sp.]
MLIKLEKEYCKLNIFLNDKKIYTVDDSTFSVGIGENSFNMSHGSFRIHDTVFHKTAVAIKDVEISENGAILKTRFGDIIIENEGKRLKVSFDGFEEYNRLFLILPSDANEKVYGSGEIFSEFNIIGERGNVWVAEHINAIQIAKKLIKQVGGFKNTKRKQSFKKYETYYAQPTFVSSKKYYYNSLTTARYSFDFNHPDFHRIKNDDISPFYIGFGEDFEEIMQGITELVGRQPPLPDWVYDGQIIATQGGSKRLLEAKSISDEKNLCANGFWIQDWEGRRVTAAGKQLYWNWEWDRELYPELDSIIRDFNSQGKKVLGYINPFLAVEKPLYKEASEKGYCVKAKDGSDYLVTITTFPAAMVDFTNPDAYNWIKNIIKKNMIEFGLSGWMADFGEYLPTDCVLFSGENPELVHNTWPAIWAKINREALEETGKLGEIMFFTRAGYSDTPRYSTMMWNGDNHTDFSIDFGLPSVIPAMLSLSVCGFGLSHSDIGGYTSFFNLRRSEELYMRWCEMSAFTPVMRGHEGLNPDLNCQFDSSERVLSHGAKMAKIHKALKPYLKEAVEYNSKTGVGVIRPLFFYYDEEKAYNECYEYLLGRDILVAPVITQGAVKRDVYLPNDEWIHLWSGKEYRGGNVTVSAPIGEIPVFVRKSAKNLIDIILEETK